MHYCFVFCTFVLSLSTIGQATEQVLHPRDVPPVVGTAIASGAGDELHVKLAVPCARWRVVGQVVPKSQWPNLEVDIVNDTRTLVFGGPSALAESRIVDIHGKDLDKNEILKRLEQDSTVLVSVSGKMVDSYYLQVIQPETLVVLLGPRDAMPAPTLLPSRAPEPTTVRYRPAMEEEQPRWRSVLIRGGSRLRGALGIGERM